MSYMPYFNPSNIHSFARDSVSPSDLEKLLALSKNQTAPNKEWIRANILLRYMKGETISGMARTLNITRPLVTHCIDKAIAYGALAALKELPGCGVKARITDEDKEWVLSLVCRSPKDLGYAHERWTYRLLKQHIRSTCEEAGHPVLSRIDKGVLNTILYHRVEVVVLPVGFSILQASIRMKVAKPGYPWSSSSKVSSSITRTGPLFHSPMIQFLGLMDICSRGEAKDLLYLR